MRMLTILFLLGVATAIFENSYTIKRITQIADFQKVLESEQVSMVYFYSDDCENCLRAGPLIEKIAEDQEGILKVYGANCDELTKDPTFEENLPYCKFEFKEHLPQISYFEPPPYKLNPYTNKPMQAQEHRYQGEGSPQSLAQFGHKLIANNVFKISNLEEFVKFEQSDPKLNKIILFTNKKTTPALFKALAVHFNERVKFGEVIQSSESEELLEEFDIKEFPQLVALENNGSNSYSREVYDGDLLFKMMKRYINSFATKERVPYEQTKQDDGREERRRRRDNANTNTNAPPNQEQVVPEVVVINESVLSKQLLRNDKPSLVHVFKDTPHKSWEETQKKYKQLFDYYAIKVETEQDEQFAKDQLNVKSYPSIRFYQVGNVGRKKATKVVFGGESNLDEISKDIQDLIDDKTVSVSEVQLQTVLRQGIDDNKVLVFMFYNTQHLGLTYRVVSQLQEYYQKFNFYSFKNAPQQVLEHFSVTQQPQLIVIFREVKDKKELDEELQPEQVKSAVYSGKLTYEEIKTFLDTFDADKKKSGKQVVELTSQSLLEEYCSKRQSQCFIALMNGNHKHIQHNDVLTRWEHQLEIVDRIKNYHGTLAAQFVYIDASCHDELLVALDISDDQLPYYIAYNSGKKQFGKMIGRFDYESINRFVEHYSKGKSSTYPLKSLEIQSKDCDAIYELRKTQPKEQAGLSDLDEEILKEILEEERLKKEQIDKELKSEKKKGKKGKGKGKRNTDDL